MKEITKKIKNAPVAVTKGGKKTAGQFLSGVKIPLRAIKLLFKHPEYWRYISMPILLNLIIYVIFGIIMVFWVMPALGNLLPHSSKNAFLQWTYTILRILIELTVAIAFLAISLFTFTMLFFLVATPFMDPLSIRLEKDEYDFHFDDGGAKQIAKDLLMSMKNAIRMALASVFWTVILFPLNFFIPVVGFLPGLLLGSYFLGLSFIMFSFEHRRLPYRDLKKILKNHRTAVLGFGLTIYWILLIPFSAIIILPVAVLGGTMLFNERLWVNKEPDPQPTETEEAAKAEEVKKLEESS